MTMRVVVLGGGYAGVSFIQGLRRESIADLEITLVDRNPYHTLLTETHTVAAGSRVPGRVEIPFHSLGAGVRVVVAEVEALDAAARLVHTSAGTLPYDYLAFCLGGADNDFGIPGVREHALFLRGVKDAERIRTQLEQLPEGAGVVVVGGGLTGVELAAEMVQTFGRRRSITVLEAARNLLPGLPAGLQDRARRRLGWLGVNVMTGARVTAVEAGKLHLADGTVLVAGLVVWTAGVKGHPMVAATGATVDRAGRAVVDEHLRSTAPGVYVLGDSAAFRLAPEAAPLPPSAQVASQMGFSAAADLGARLRGEEGRRFKPVLRGVLCDLGGLNASGLVHRFQVHGLVGAVAKRGSVLAYLWKTTGLKGFLIHLVHTAADLLAPLLRKMA